MGVMDVGVLIEREMKVSRQIYRKGKRYDYGAIKVNVPKEYIGRRAKVIIVIK